MTKIKLEPTEEELKAQSLQRWKLVKRLQDIVLKDNMTHEEGSSLLMTHPEKDIMLVPVEYKFRSHSTMGYVWV